MAITQPYVPAYRLPLWQGVLDELARNDVECRVFYGGDSEQLAIRARRGDGVVPDWATQVATRTWRPSKRLPKFMYRNLPKPWRDKRTLLVTEMQVSNLNAWKAAATGRPFITIGHGISETTDQNRIATFLEGRLNRLAAHVLTYTERGREHVIESSRTDPSRVSAFRNSTDTRQLEDALRSVVDDDQVAFRTKHGIPVDAQIALYLGAINEHKRVDLLVDAARAVFARDDSWWLVVAGDGPEASKLHALAVESGRVVMLGQVGPEVFSTAATLSVLLVNPGRVGLVAVDALVMHLPILTTSAGDRAPEFEYLREGIDVVEVEPSIDSYADAWVSGIPRADSRSENIPSIASAASVISSAILQQMEGMK
ncbi:glycosyltransferase [Herbiconiux daphne]|uniref:D-inositol 3-phosphate glycosyltransferase n=1 Tax=Herbiconiux daphne TaxID=2970914 RepID=A0ABT2H6K9_9MICO|nr:glycosyltransferase [Herbiconiux daphne]MCS5735575.1 glycosyltransferase [Herbiconiux daphne]